MNWRMKLGESSPNEEEKTMKLRLKCALAVLACLALGCISPLLAQQKGQYVPGQWGLNAGAIPDPGITYGNLTVNYSSSTLNGPNGNSINGITGTYGFWVNESS